MCLLTYLKEFQFEAVNDFFLDLSTDWSAPCPQSFDRANVEAVHQVVLGQSHCD